MKTLDNFKKSISDLKSFKHGDEGTHSTCRNRLKKEGSKSKCCICKPHKDCSL